MVAGGSRGTASGEGGVVAGGSRGTASGEGGVVAGGSRGTASGERSRVVTGGEIKMPIHGGCPRHATTVLE